MKLFSVILLNIIVCSNLLGQKAINKNLSDFDDSPFHFGFLVSGNTSFFSIKRSSEISFSDSLVGLYNLSQPGFNLALLASYNPVKNLSFRFIPGLSFQDRFLIYQFLQQNGKIKDEIRQTESVWLEFPLILKMRTNRIGNFAAYGLFGGKYGIDMQSQKDVNNAANGSVVLKLKNKDYGYEVGGGMDFFMPYFKFAIEFKSCLGIPDLLIHENDKYINSISSLKSRSFVFTLSFEG